MPKLPTFPTLYDNALQLSTTDLKRLGMLNPNSLLFKSLYWGVSKQASISIWVSTLAPQSYIDFSYSIKQRKYDYKINLVALPSNLGKGKVWFFVCPITNQRCRKLYFRQGYFCHREAFKGGMYSCQIKDKTIGLYEVLEAYQKLDKLHLQLEQKHFKTHYAGQPTKRYTRLMKQIKRYERVLGGFPNQTFLNDHFKVTL